MAEDLKPENELLPAASEPVGATAGEPHQATEQPDPADEAPPYQSRFQLVLGVLLGIGMAAVAATAIFLATDREEVGPPPKWSAWEPSAKTGEAALEQIAQHVGLRYYLPGGRQLVDVEGEPLNFAGLPMKVTVTGDDGTLRHYDEGALFKLDGGGRNGAINRGKPSTGRLLVLGRQSFELALYTFRYVKNLDVVVAMLPPAPGDKPTRAMFFRRQDLEPRLRAPLHMSLPNPPPRINKLRSTERKQLEQLTAPNLYVYEIKQGLDGFPVMTLERPR